MKLINYKYGYIDAFDCVIHGKIIMTEKEWKAARLYLLKGARRWLPSYPWIVGMIKEDEQIIISAKRGGLFNIRVPATETLAKKYNLRGYKHANYMIEVLI